MDYIKHLLNRRCVMNTRVDRELVFLTSRPNWDRSPAGECACAPPLLVQGRSHSLAEEGMGGPNSD